MTDISFTLTDTDFLQEELDFSEINPIDFENLVFHLLDEMGFSNLTWRKGGEGNSATDGGRDLEATYWTVSPAVSREEKYWFEVKYRSNQLEKSQVQKTILNASGNKSKDNIVIITNKTISNPTLDWIKEFHESNNTPLASVWQGHDLDLILRKNPRTLARFIPSSLAFGGRCKVIESKFTNLMLLPAGGELDELWERRDEFEDNSLLTLVAIISEVEYGDILKHPWGMDLDKLRLFSTLVMGVLNIYPFVSMCSSLNREQRVIIDGLSYLAQCLLLRSGAELVAKALFDPEQYTDPEKKFPDELRVTRLAPIFNAIFHDLGMHCSSKYCMKLHHMSPDDKPDYFLRFIESSYQPQKDEHFLIISSVKDECKLGIVEKHQHCPLGESENTPDNIAKLENKLEFARLVITNRAGETIEKLDKANSS